MYPIFFLKKELCMNEFKKLILFCAIMTSLHAHIVYATKATAPKSNNSGSAHCKQSTADNYTNANNSTKSGRVRVVHFLGKPQNSQQPKTNCCTVS